MTFTTDSLQRLARLRALFLNANDGLADYWDSEESLALYDQTFAERIGWKWRFVMLDLERLNWSMPEGTLLDWGCGTGVASRTLLQSPIAKSIRAVSLYDRSRSAMRFAFQQCSRRFPTLAIQQGDAPDAETVVISHVLNELSRDALNALLARLDNATAILWVEPSLKTVSRKLIEVREALRERFHLVAPCVHQARCGMLSPENERHWCHHFAEPPAEAFTESKWAKFSQAMQIDLRDLSLSYLVFDKRPVSPLEQSAKRLIGNARLYKATASLLLCDERGVGEVELAKRDFPDAFKSLKKGNAPSLQTLDIENGRVVKWG